MTNMEIADSLRAAFRSNWDENLERLIAQRIPEMESEFGHYRLENGTMRLIDNESYFSVAMWREHIIAVPPEPGKQLEPNTECSFCRDTKWVKSPDLGGRMIRCECPPEARVKYSGYKTKPVNITDEIRKLRDAVNTDKRPPEPDKSLGFWLEQRGEDWEVHDRGLANGFRRSSTYETILWRAMKFWKGAYFGLKESTEKIGEQKEQ